MDSLLTQLNAELEGIVEKTRRSLVEVRSGSHGSGAGTVWHSNGLILTNAHVVVDRGRRKPLHVTLSDGRAFVAHLLAVDPERDLAALSVAVGELPAIQLGDSQQLRAGQWVFALGHPWGVRGAVTAGIVIGDTAVGPQRTSLPAPTAPGDWLAVSLHLRPGYSGGALVDESGRLVGINTMMTGPDVGVAVPVHVAKRFLQQALDRRN